MSTRRLPESRRNSARGAERLLPECLDPDGCLVRILIQHQANEMMDAWPARSTRISTHRVTLGREPIYTLTANLPVGVPELSCYNFRLDDRKTAFSRRSDDPRPDIRMRNLLIQQRRKGCHVRPVVQDDVDRADLSTSPTDSFDACELVVEGCAVGPTEYVERDRTALSRLLRQPRD